MPAKGRFTRLDAFSKTVEDARVRTSAGGIITITSLLVILWLVWGEWADYRRILVHPELVVDKGRGEKMEIHMNISFPRLPCELLTLDVMDVSGEIQSGVVHGVQKVRLSAENEGSRVIESKALDLHQDEAPHMDPNYCGECYGAPAPSSASKPGCCNTCAEVRDAYASVSWSFGRGENVAQCEREHYAEHLDAQRKEGCRIEGSIRVNKVVGNFHFAPGKSFSNGQMHVHDLENYFRSEEAHTFTHTVHSLRFGPPMSLEAQRRFADASRQGQTWATGYTQTNPLDGLTLKTDARPYNYMYFVKVVSTAYLPLGWESIGRKDGAGGLWGSVDSDRPHELIALGEYGTGPAGSIETHQYSVTRHERNLEGGTDAAEGHKERLHARGGIPGVFFVSQSDLPQIQASSKLIRGQSYDISPMKVINREKRTKTFSAFLVGVCAVIGGTLTVAAAVDRGLYEGSRRMKKLHEG
ncbi:MAG: hypothetical protein Q9162_003764 [Coniocarpon cinnabarinum]